MPTPFKISRTSAPSSESTITVPSFSVPDNTYTPPPSIVMSVPSIFILLLAASI